MRYLLILPLLVMLSCGTGRLHMAAVEATELPAVAPDYTLVLVGDAGYAATHPAVLDMLSAQLAAASPTRTGVLFLGDNVYPSGLPDEEGPTREMALRTLQVQLNAVSGFAGEVWWIGGNHDMAGHDGENRLRLQENMLEAARGDVTAFLPGNSCRGPHVEVLPQQLLLIAFNSQAFLDDSPGCTHDHDSMMAALPAYVSAYPGLPVVVAAHHPLRSDGPHGGRFSWRSHVFPLNDVVRGAYLPLPVIGTAYVLARKWIGHPQDQSSRGYRQWRRELSQLLATLPPSVVVSGHEHVLQVLDLAPHWQLISGTGSEHTTVIPRQHSRFAADDNGFLKVHCYPDGSMWVEAWAVDDYEARGRRIGLLQVK